MIENFNICMSENTVEQFMVSMMYD